MEIISTKKCFVCSSPFIATRILIRLAIRIWIFVRKEQITIFWIYNHVEKAKCFGHAFPFPLVLKSLSTLHINVVD